YPGGARSPPAQAPPEKLGATPASLERLPGGARRSSRDPSATSGRRDATFLPPLHRAGRSGPIPNHAGSIHDRDDRRKHWGGRALSEHSHSSLLPATLWLATGGLSRQLSHWTTNGESSTVGEAHRPRCLGCSPCCTQNTKGLIDL